MKRTKEPITEDDKVWGSAETTINLGNYENIKIQTGQSRTLAPDENERTIRKEMIEEMVEDLRRSKRKILKSED